MKKNWQLDIFHSRYSCSFLVIINLLVYYPTLKNGFLTGWMINGWCSAIIRKEVGLSITCGISSLIFM